MAEMKWTPGPWDLREVAHEATHYSKRRIYRMEIIAPQYLFGRRTHSRDIAQIVDFCDWTDHPHNAQLIVSAPDLYRAAALTCLMFERKNSSTADADWMGDDEHEAWTALEKAMARARGEVLITPRHIVAFVDSLPSTYDEAQLREAAAEWFRERGIIGKPEREIALGHVLDAWRVARARSAGNGA